MPHRYLFQIRMIACLLFVSASSTVFASSTLDTFMKDVWQNNPAIQAAVSALEVTKSRKLAAGQPIYNPEIDIEFARADINTLSIGLNQTFDRGDKRSAAISKADADIQLAQAELNKQRQTIAAEALAALVNLQSANKVQNLAHQRVKLMQELLENTEKRQHAGDVGQQDISLTRVALSQAKIQFVNTAVQQSNFTTQLHLITESISYKWPELKQEPPIPTALMETGRYLYQLPSINALKAELSAAKSNVYLSKAEQKTDPSFGLRGGVEGGEALMGLSFSMPLFIRNNYRAEVDVANHEALQIEHLLLSAVRRSEARLNGTHKRFQITYDAWQTWKNTGLNSLNEQMSLIKTIWESGEMNTSEYLVQAKQNIDVQVAAVELSSQMWQAWIEWLVASGQVEQYITQTKP